MRRTPVLIVGGGPAGSAAAITLARAGLRPRLVERASGPRDIVCGGFLGWDALRLLRELEIDIAALGARPIHRLRLVAGKTVVEADLPHAAAGLSRRRLDAALLAAAESSGVRVSRGQAARDLDPERRTVRLGNEVVACDALFLATGKHELRGAARAIENRREEPALGLRCSLRFSPRLEASLAGVIELHLLNQGYAGLLIQENGSANLCLSIARQRLSEAGGIPALFEAIMVEAPVLAERIGPMSPQKFEAIAGVPYGWRARETADGVFRLGDQAAVIASLAGDGIAIALASGCSGAAALLEHGPDGARRWQQGFSRRAWSPVSVAETLRYVAERPWLRAPMLQILRLKPALATRAARLTRIGDG